MSERTISIVGSRAFAATESYVNYLLDRFPCDTLVSGGARGPDSVAEAEARRRGIHVVSFRPRGDSRGFVIERYEDGERVGTWQEEEGWYFQTFTEAAKRRNWLIAREARGGMHALWDGMSGGTAHAIAAALRSCRRDAIPTVWMEGDS